jgi:hypothetical protein
MDISEILGGANAPVEPASTVETPAPEIQEPTPATTAETPATPRDERGRFTRSEAPATADVTPPAPNPEERQPHMVPVSAMLEERRKRQELEARLQAAQQPPPVLEIKDEDYWQTPVDATRKVVKHETAMLESQIREIKYQLAEDFTRQAHSDFDQVKQEFVEKVVNRDPWAIAVAQQLDMQSNPAKFMYDSVKKFSVVDKVGDLNAFEARIRAEERAKVLIEVQSKKAPAPEIPRSLNSEPSEPTPSTPEGFEPTPLSNIVKFNF